MKNENKTEYRSYFLDRIDAMGGYVPGEQPKEEGILKLNTNESPFPPSPGVCETLKNFDYTRLHLYPDPTAEDLRAALGEMFGLKSANVIAGNGSDDLLNIIIRCFTDKDHPAAFLWPTYSLYTTLCALQGSPEIRIPLQKDFSLPYDLLDQAKKANLLIITRPNAPTGNSFPKPIMAEICRLFKGIVLIDEAYADFATDNCADFVREFPNVIVCRTFSKSRSLAGLRFGYAMAHEKIIDGLMKMKDSYNVSMLSQKLALASLQDPAYFTDCISRIRVSREILTRSLKDMGFKIVDSETNFLFACPPDGDGERYFKELKARKVYVRYFPGEVTGAWVRITIGDAEGVSRLIRTTKEIYNK